MDPVALDEGRPTWQSSKAFVLAAVGAGTGFAHFLRFPAMFHAYGVGSFTIAYLICLLIVAWPVGIIEAILGQHYRKGAVQTLKAVHPRAEGIGFAAMFFNSGIVTVYYSLGLSWLLFPYGFSCFFSPLPFHVNHNATQLQDFFFTNALFSGPQNIPVFAGVFFVWLFTLALAIKGIKSVSWASYVLVPIPLVALIGLAIYSIVATNGVAFGIFLMPYTTNLPDTVLNMSVASGIHPLHGQRTSQFTLFQSFSLWANAIGQALFSMQVGNGALIAFGSYTRPQHNPAAICGVITCVNFALALIVALCAGSSFHVMNWVDAPTHRFYFHELVNVTHTEGVPNSLFPLSQGLWVPFAVFPTLLALGNNNISAIVFFLAILLIGLVSMSSTINDLLAILWDRSLSLRSSYLVAFMCLGGAILTMPLALRDGYDIITAVDAAVVGTVLPLIVFAECLAIGYGWADRSIGDTLAERGETGCYKIRSFFEIAYQHSISKLKELMDVNGRHFFGHSIFPFLIKIFVPLLIIITSVGHIVEFLSHPIVSYVNTSPQTPTITTNGSSNPFNDAFGNGTLSTNTVTQSDEELVVRLVYVIVILLAALLTVGSAIAAAGKKVALPWTEDFTVEACTASVVANSSGLTPKTSSDKIELRAA